MNEVSNCERLLGNEEKNLFAILDDERSILLNKIRSSADDPEEILDLLDEYTNEVVNVTCNVLASKLGI